MSTWTPILIKYNPDQPRDEHGRFTSGAAGDSSNVPSYQQLSSMKEVSGPLGSQGGTWRQSKDGTTYIVKPLKDDVHGYNEVAAGQVYREAGIKFPNTGMVHDPKTGKAYLVSQKIDGLHQESVRGWHANPELQAKAAQDFGTDALLSHWDVHGLDADNTLVDQHGDPVRIESGGAMAFRGMGGPKGESFSANGPWQEPSSMRTSPQGRAMYGNMSDQQAADSLERAGKINLGNVQQRWDSAGVPRSVSQSWMDTLKARQAQIPGIVSKLRGSKKSWQPALIKTTWAPQFIKLWRPGIIKYDPDEPRNSHGEWTSGGGGGAVNADGTTGKTTGAQAGSPNAGLKDLPHWKDSSGATTSAVVNGMEGDKALYDKVLSDPSMVAHSWHGNDVSAYQVGDQVLLVHKYGPQSVAVYAVQGVLGTSGLVATPGGNAVYNIRQGYYGGHAAPVLQNVDVPKSVLGGTVDVPTPTYGGGVGHTSGGYTPPPGTPTIELKPFPGGESLNPGAAADAAATTAAVTSAGAAAVPFSTTMLVGQTQDAAGGWQSDYKGPGAGMEGLGKVGGDKPAGAGELPGSRSHIQSSSAPTTAALKDMYSGDVKVSQTTNIDDSHSAVRLEDGRTLMLERTSDGKIKARIDSKFDWSQVSTKPTGSGGLPGSRSMVKSSSASTTEALKDLYGGKVGIASSTALDDSKTLITLEDGRQLLADRRETGMYVKLTKSGAPAVATPQPAITAGSTADQVNSVLNSGVKQYDVNSTELGSSYPKSSYSSSEIQALKTYTGSGHEPINKAMIEKALRYQTGQHADTVKALDSAMTKNTLPENTMVMRGISSDSIFDAHEGASGQIGASTVTPGMVISDRGYLSTTVGPRPAFSSNPVWLRIVAPKGSPGAYVNQGISVHDSENEWIGPRATKLAVTDVAKGRYDALGNQVSTGGRTITAVMLP